MATQQKEPLFPNTPLTAEEKLTARPGDDLVHAALLSGPGAKYPDFRFTDADGRAPDENNPRQYGTNFVSKPIDRFTLLDAMEEALGTDTFIERAREWDLRRKGPLDMLGNCHDNTQWAVRVYLGKDPITGQDSPRDEPPPHVKLAQAMKEEMIQEVVFPAKGKR